MNTAGDDKQRQQQDDERHVVEEDLVLQLVHHSAHDQAYRYGHAEEEGNNEFVGVLLPPVFCYQRTDSNHQKHESERNQRPCRMYKLFHSI